MFQRLYFIALLLICSGILSAEDTSWIEIVETVKLGIVVINTENGLGTGFFINPNEIIEHRSPLYAFTEPEFY